MTARQGEVLCLVALAGLAAVAAAQRRPPPSMIARAVAVLPPRLSPAVATSASRQVNGAAALLALAALTDSAVEHYRGSFHNKTMYVPLAVSALTLVASLRDVVAPPSQGEKKHDVVDALAIATGTIGTGFHVYNILKRPGRLSWHNLFYAAPIGAPAALSLAGLLRKATMFIPGRATIAGLLPGKVLSSLVSLGLLGTTAEAGLMHFRGAYHNPAMMIPVTAPPIAAGMLAYAASSPAQPHPQIRWMLRALAAIGLIGSGFHAYGIQRNMGGWRNWSQNILNGPPLPAPPAFTALAIAGLAALRLLERRS
jgi:hypothetical protein